MFTKPQDVVVALKLSLKSANASYAELGKALGMSASEVHAAVRRLVDARLMEPETKTVRREALRNFLIHGVPYAFPAQLKEVTRGMPTAWGAPVMTQEPGTAEKLPPVWPDPDGPIQGSALKPLYSSVPTAARHDAALYDLLALVDALRVGRARDRNLAEKQITQRLNSHASA
jgi:DNA-binding Lrp family transcriptional regulator